VIDHDHDPGRSPSPIPPEGRSTIPERSEVHDPRPKSGPRSPSGARSTTTTTITITITHRRGIGNVRAAASFIDDKLTNDLRGRVIDVRAAAFRPRRTQ